MTRQTRLVALAVFAGGVLGGSAAAAGPKSELYNFGALKAAAPEAARLQAEQWLQSVGKADLVGQPSFQAVWSRPDRTVLDRVVDTIRLGSDDAARLLDEARAADATAPKEVPAVLKDAKQAPFFRANLAVAYAKALSNRRVYEEALEALRAVPAEQAADPAAYFFHKAVAEHALMLKDNASQSIVRLLDDVADAPERYKMVATLMFLDMQAWKKDQKDLENIARLMDNSERRLDLSRGGKKTQDIQKKIVFRLEEQIKDLENQAKGGGQAQACPGGTQPRPGNSNQPSQPQQDSIGGTNSGPGKVDEKRLKQMAEGWGKLPEKERAKAMMEMTRDLPPRYREVIENYFKQLARTQQQQP